MKVSVISRIVDGYFKLLEFVLFVCMSGMVVTVFGNVVLRYGFNSGILVSEELSRFLFIWMTFIGAVVVLREHGHLGMDTVVKMLPLSGAKIARALSDVLVIVCCVFLIAGTWQQHEVNMGNLSPVMMVPLEYVYSVAYISGISMIAITFVSLIATFLPGARDPRQSLFVDAEEEAALKSVDAAAGKSDP
ncbi:MULTISPECIES: TRAP transporter small permease [unclassified Rhizobium]|uniref:TRAP transporter small permease n=1 Tax=unclassified Rhizobium TaxID=2613769 RepID=UPI001AD9A003|nr:MULTISPECIES: TRAP transporter small permease [unclassified Rhizobium]MBO9127909.1 TRAP transporter small permease [Rhizobium sp. 16-488-2b]MBO9178303.1 TRAP transporter small permease [Rhizobium sp. 16-488-2a]